MTDVRRSHPSKIRDRRPQPRAYFHDHDTDSMTAAEVIVSDDDYTGLLDADGKPIYRRRVKFGFVP